MALFDWLGPKKNTKAKLDSQPVSSGLSRMEPTRPVMRGEGPVLHGPHSIPGKPANRKHERMARRELLYAVVRECMANAGVVSVSYKFKVLSLDARGRQFLVMLDVSRDYASDATRLAEIEAMVAQAAKSRYDIVVTAVYWRINDHVAVGLASRPAPLAVPSRPAPLASAPAPLVSQPTPLAAVEPPGPQRGFEPLHPTEIAAFKQALANGTKPSAAKHPAPNALLLTGFEDTELPDPEMRAQVLSATQYGEPR